MTRIKIFVMLLALAAMVKVGTQEYLYRSGTHDVLIAAYRERAVAACQRDMRTAGIIVNPNSWPRKSDVRIVIGRSELDVWFWQFDHDQWHARYRHPYLQLGAADQQLGMHCDYDLVTGITAVTRS
jgi:hypothetical protein